MSTEPDRATETPEEPFVVNTDDRHEADIPSGATSGVDNPTREPRDLEPLMSPGPTPLPREMIRLLERQIKAQLPDSPPPPSLPRDSPDAARAGQGSVELVTDDGTATRLIRPRRVRAPMSWARQAAVLSASFVAVLAALNVAVIAYHAVRAQGELNGARSMLTQARTAIAADDVDAALAAVIGMRSKTVAAEASTSGSVWHVDEHLPFVGSSLRSVASLSTSVDDITATALPQLTRSVTSLKGGELRDADGSLNLRLVEETAGSLDVATASLISARADVAALPAHPLIGAVGNARSQLLGQIDGLLTDLNGADQAARLAPAMLGANGPRKYFLALMNPAEARGAGGLVGAYAVVVAERGVLRLEKVGIDDDFPPFIVPATTVSPDFTARWRSLDGDTDIRSATDSPHFPWDAEVITEMWRKRTGERLDGVIALDPAAAGALVPDDHPLMLSDGTTLTGAQLPTYVEQTLYAKFGSSGDQAPRKLELEEIERGLFTTLQSVDDPAATLRALGRAAGERKLFLESTHPDEQAILAATPLGGAMPDTPGPFVGLSIYNAIGNKMDAYLQRGITWTAGACPSPGGARLLTTAVTLDNQAPLARLAGEVAGNHAPDLGPRPAGSNRSWVSVYGSVGAIPVSATLDGAPVSVRVQTERSHPVVGIYVDLAPRQSRVLTITWRDARTVDSEGKPVSLAPQAPFVQPLVKPARTHVAVLTC